jgi:cation diffusion facilitator CzcD-associated flavoprotein CzcO
LLEDNFEFDAVVVASGHYHAPQIPDIPGLKQIKDLWPNRIWHSKRYRTPGAFTNKVQHDALSLPSALTCSFRTFY